METGRPTLQLMYGNDVVAEHPGEVVTDVFEADTMAGELALDTDVVEQQGSSRQVVTEVSTICQSADKLSPRHWLASAQSSTDLIRLGILRNRRMK